MKNNKDFSIDIHCHPTYKPFGRSFIKGKRIIQSSNVSLKNSIWHYSPPKLFDKLFNNIIGLTKFSQANLTSSIYGDVMVMVVSLGSIEKWFFNNGLGTSDVSDLIADFTAEIGKGRIDAIQNMQDYFEDLKDEVRFLEEMDDKIVNIDGKFCKYKIVKNFKELEEIINNNENVISKFNESDENNQTTISIILSIEGLHILNCGLLNSQQILGNPPNIDEVIANAKALKEFKYKPFFVTFSHHFYNQLCGHSQSLSKSVAKICNQTNGFHTSFTETGLKVLDVLLDNTDNKRILIDIKHLSPEGRIDFFKIREKRFPNIPIIISHGACNGLPYYKATQSNYPDLGTTFFSEEINFYDNEIIQMAKSGGIIGLQLDERRIASEETLKQTKHSIFRNKIMRYRSELVWKQIQYIAELLDDNGLFAWGNIAIGSDYDGMVDPVNSFWTFEQYPALKSYLERHAYNYMNSATNKLKLSQNKISADVIVQNIFQTNSWNFFQKWYS